MKKLFLSMTVIILAVLLPLTANAATISAVTNSEKAEAAIGEIIEVTVKLDEKEVESMQFDLKYDNEMFKYVQESAKSNLNSTLSHEIEPGIVRVSVIDNKVDGKTDNEVTMQFQAKATGSNANFSIVDGSIEVGKTSEKIEEKLKKPTVTIYMVYAIPDENGGGQVVGETTQYVNAQGQVITALPKTGESVKAKAVRSINGVYGTLGNLQNVIPYAFQTSETTLSLADLKAEFGNSITTTVKDIAKTGDTITVNGNTYTIVIYGDVNCDGKVSTYDALLAKKINLGKLTVSEYAREAANIEKSNIDTTAMQKFILRLRKTATDTILDKFPVKAGGAVETEKVAALDLSNVNTDAFVSEETIIATVKSTNSVVITRDMLKCTVLEAPEGVDVSNIITYEETSAGSGIWNIKVTAPVVGTYKIVPVVSGNNVINGEIKLDTIAVVVTEIGPKVEAITVSGVVNSALRYNSTPIATIKVKEPVDAVLTKKMITAQTVVTKADGTPATSMLSVENGTETGTFNLVLNATEAATYVVKPAVEVDGVSIKDETIEQFQVVVSEDYNITDIELYDGTKKLPLVTTANDAYVEYTLRTGNHVELSMKYIHKYPNGVTIEVAESNNKITGGKLTLLTDSGSELLTAATRFRTKFDDVVEYNGDGTITNGTDYVSKLYVEAGSQVNSGNARLTIAVNNGSYSTTLPLVIHVEKPELQSIKLDGTTYAKGTTESFDLNLYTSEVDGNNKVKKVGSYYYTIIDVEISNQFEPVDLINDNYKKGNETPLTPSYSVVVDTPANSNFNNLIKLQGFTKNGDEYTPQNSGSQTITAIGIAYMSPTSPANSNVTGDGALQIIFGESNVITVNVKKDPVTRAASMMRAAKANVPCEHEKDEGTVTVEATVETVGTKVFKCTKCGEVLETVELPKLVDNTNTNTNVTTNTSVNNTVGNTVTNSTDNTTTNTTTGNTVTPPNDDNTVEEPEEVCNHEKDVTTGIITKSSTCTEEGTATYNCKNKDCDYVFEEVIGKKAHKYGEDGKCTVCGELDPNYVAPVEESTNTVSEGQDETPAA